MLVFAEEERFDKKGSIIGQVVSISDEVNAADEKVIIRVLGILMKAEPQPFQIIEIVREQ